MRFLISTLTILTLAAGCTKKLQTERVDDRTKTPSGDATGTPTAPVDPTPTGSPAPNPVPSATPAPETAAPASPATPPVPDAPAVHIPPTDPVTPANPVLPANPVTDPATPPNPPMPVLPAGEFTLNKVLCPGGAEIPATTVVLKSSDGSLSVTGDSEIKARLLGGAPSLTLVAEDGNLVLKSTDSLPGFCNAQKPLTLVFGTAPATPTACVKHWSLDSGTANDDPKIFENELRWAANALKKGQIRGLTNTAELKGDFEVRLEFKHFSPGGRGAHFRLKLEDQNDPKVFAFAMVGNNSASAGLGPMLMAAITNDGVVDEANNATLGSRSQPDGVFTMTKVGKNLTVTAATVDGKIERKTSASYLFSDSRYRLKLEAGNNSNLASLGNPTGIGFAKLQVKDASGTELSSSDAFTCDSLGP